MNANLKNSIEPFFALLRLVIIAAAAVWGFFAPLDEGSRASFLACLAVSAAFGLILWAVLHRGSVSANLVYKAALIVDLLLVYWAVRVTGGVHSNLIVGFYLLVAFHAFYSGMRVGIAASIAASALLLALPERGGWWGDSAVRLGFLQILAIGAGLLSERERAFAHDLSETRRAIEQAEKMAVLGTLGAGIAHEVNNPASSILARVERVLLEAQERGLTDETTKDLEVIRKHAIRIGAILQRLLAFARPEGFNLQLLNLNHIIEGIIPLVEGRLREKRVSLSLDLAGDPPSLIGDQTRIEEVILNIVNNAIDASFWGSVIGISTEVHNGFLELRVTDKGAGIGSKDLPHVFDPFFTTKPAGQGTGLGLYVAWQIVKDHGATISISSEPQRGATVTVRFSVVSESEKGERTAAGNPA